MNDATRLRYLRFALVMVGLIFMNLDEGWIDGSFAVAKKGALQWATPSGAREPRSWRSLIVTGCQFLFVLRVPLPMK